MMNRRGFLAACLSLCAAPAIVRASSLMPIVVRRPSPTPLNLGLPWSFALFGEAGLIANQLVRVDHAAFKSVCDEMDPWLHVYSQPITFPALEESMIVKGIALLDSAGNTITSTEFTDLEVPSHMSQEFKNFYARIK